MSLLGIDAGTTGCKASVFSLEGRLLAQAYEEYDVQRPQPGWAELEAFEVWEKVKRAIARAAQATKRDPIAALAVSSLGEAMVPVTRDRRILGPALLNFDQRGAEYLPGLAAGLDNESLYRLNGNPLGNHFGLTKLIWLKQHRPELYAAADTFLHWSGFVAFMLGAEPHTDATLANRSLVFDLDRCDWSDELLAWAGLDREKLPEIVLSGNLVGHVHPLAAAELGLPAGVAIASGAHDQCANALGCGVIRPGQAMYGMGTYNCIAPVFDGRRPPQEMLASGLNTEHHAVPGCFISFIYNMGGSLVKWFRDTYAATEHRQAKADGRDVYTDLFAELGDGPNAGSAGDPAGALGSPSPILVYPHFNDTGFPDFLPASRGAILGVNLSTRRADILKGILEANVFSLKEPLEALPGLGLQVEEFRASGGGSKSDAGVQICADILGRPFQRPAVSEAGTLGAAILAGMAVARSHEVRGRSRLGQFDSLSQAVESMVRLEKSFEPDPARHARYLERYAQYRTLRPLLGDFLGTISSLQA
jgi:xylulokinase